MKLGITPGTKLGTTVGISVRSLVVAATAVLTIAGCGSSSATGSGPSSSSGASPSPGQTRARGGVAGELVKVDGTRLTLSGAQGDILVALLSQTQVERDVTASASDLVVGQCVTAAGPRNGTSINAITVLIQAPQQGQCGGRGRGGTGAGAGGTPSQSPAASPPAGANGFAAGRLTAVSGQSVTLHSARGDETVVVQNGAKITKLVAATAADLQVGECLTAGGQRDAAGVVQARTIAVLPPGPSGCSSGGGFGFGAGRGASNGGGGGAGGGGGGGAPVGVTPPDA